MDAVKGILAFLALFGVIVGIRVAVRLLANGAVNVISGAVSRAKQNKQLEGQQTSADVYSPSSQLPDELKNAK